MKTSKIKRPGLCKIIAVGTFAAISITSPAVGEDKNPQALKFLQEIQDQLNEVSGLKDRSIRVHVTPDQKRKIEITPSSVSFSYGFLKNMENINQLVATMAHMTAHISFDYVPTPAVPESGEGGAADSAARDNVKATGRTKYPDKSNPPQATGPFHEQGPGIIERPSYHNKEYDYAVNKSDILAAEQERTSDKAAIRFLNLAGFCPSDYSRLLHYFYENPQRLLGNKHFALDADQWQRIDDVDRWADPAAKCSDAQNALTQKHAPAFDQLQAGILQALKSKD